MTTSNSQLTEKSQPKLRKGLGCIGTLLLILFLFVVINGIAYSIINYATMRLRVNGYSMGTTLPDGTYIIANKHAYLQDEPKRGDIVILQVPFTSDKVLQVKRVIGLPGEVISIDQEGRVSVNNAHLIEPYVFQKATYTGQWTIPEGEYFVLGDNRPDSADSHSWGFLPRKNIIAKAVFVYFPFNSFGEITNNNYSP